MICCSVLFLQNLFCLRHTTEHMIDSHNHTDFSEDCFIPLETMIDAAISKGIKHYTITDHLDLDYQDKRFTFALDHAQRKTSIQQAQLYSQK